MLITGLVKAPPIPPQTTQANAKFGGHQGNRSELGRRGIVATFLAYLNPSFLKFRLIRIHGACDRLGDIRGASARSITRAGSIIRIAIRLTAENTGEGLSLFALRPLSMPGAGCPRHVPIEACSMGMTTRWRPQVRSEAAAIAGRTAEGALGKRNTPGVRPACFLKCSLSERRDRYQDFCSLPAGAGVAAPAAGAAASATGTTASGVGGADPAAAGASVFSAFLADPRLPRFL